ncbi:MAG: amidase family protein [Nanoarchaeota archaeon]|nr:amidase family protein [Nanoarchaeota archaeon]
MVKNAHIKQKTAKMQAGELTCVQNVQDFLAEVKKNNEKYNIFLEINESALKRAQQLDEKRNSGESLGKFFGLTFALKSNMSMEDMTISCASKTLENYKGTYNADVVETILKEDGIILGMLNNDQFANGISGETSAFNPTINPAAPKRVPGGSSSASGAVIAADMVDVALGSDTGGSNRNPASHCGVVGIKPSYGRVSRYGLVDLSMSLDQIGPLTRDVESSAYVLQELAGYSQNDSVTVDKEVQSYEKLEKNYTIGVIKQFDSMIEDSRIKELYELKKKELLALGHTIKEVEVEHIELAVQAYYPIVYTEFFSGTRKLDSVKYGNKFDETAGTEALRRAMGGREISKSEFDGAYYKKALKVKEIISKSLSKAFEGIDFILTPIAPTLPHKLGEEMSVEASYAMDVFTCPSNLAGICAGAVSVDRIQDGDENIPVGFQIMANSFEEDKMFQGLYLLESLQK